MMTMPVCARVSLCVMCAKICARVALSKKADPANTNMFILLILAAGNPLIEQTKQLCAPRKGKQLLFLWHY